MPNAEAVEACSFLLHKPVAWADVLEVADGLDTELVVPALGVCLCGRVTWLPVEVDTAQLSR